MNKPWQKIPMVALINQARTVNPNLGHRVTNGRFDLVEVVYDGRGSGTVTVIGEALPLSGHEERLRQIIRNHGLTPCA